MTDVLGICLAVGVFHIHHLALELFFQKFLFLIFTILFQKFFFFLFKIGCLCARGRPHKS